MNVTKMTAITYNGESRLLVENNKQEDKLIKPVTKKVSPEELQKIIAKNHLHIKNGVKLGSADYTALDVKNQTRIDDCELRRTNDGEQTTKVLRGITITGLSVTVVGLAGCAWHLVKDQENRVVAGLTAIGLIVAGLAESYALYSQIKQIDALQHDRALLLSRKLNS